MIIWVSQRNYAWALNKWLGRDVRINTYLDSHYIEITKPGFLYNPRLRKRVRLSRNILLELAMVHRTKQFYKCKCSKIEI